MSLTYLLLFIAFSAFAQPKPRIEVIPNPQTIEDFEHEFKGCPQNSECDQIMGHMLNRWKTFIKNLQNTSDFNKRAQALESFRSKYGIPVEVYTTQKSQTGLKPSLNSSPCKEHNPKDIGGKIFRGTLFVKALSQQKATVWRDQSQIELALEGSHLFPQPVKVYYSKEASTYLLPIDDQPLFIKNRELYVLREEDDLYYMLKVSPDGTWKIVNVDFTQLIQWEDKRQNVACPEDKAKAPNAFNYTFCKSIWDEDSKKAITVRMEQGCSI